MLHRSMPDVRTFTTTIEVKHTFWSTPVDVLRYCEARDEELSEALRPLTFAAAESLFLVSGGRVLAGFDRQAMRGHVLATSIPRHMDTIAYGLRVIDLSDDGGVDWVWLKRWRPRSMALIPLVEAGIGHGTLVAVSYSRQFTPEDAAPLRSAADRCAMLLALRSLRIELTHARAALDAAPEALVGVDDHGVVRVCNESARRVFGVDPTGRALAASVDTDFVDDDLAWQQSASLPIRPVRVRRSSCSVGMGLAFIDRTAEQNAAFELLKQQELSAMLLNAVPARACVLDRDGVVVATNDRFRDEGPLGRGRRSAPGIGDDYMAWLAEVDESLHRAVVAILDGDTEDVRREIETTYRRRRRWTDLHVIGARQQDAAALVLHTDITERKQSELDLRRRATHDALTGLPNRVLLVDRLTHALSRVARSHSKIGVLFCDLDGFKDVNTRFGHQAGDLVLTTVARRLQYACRTSDTVARVSGDEFVILLEDVENPGEMEDVAGRIVAALSEPIELEEGVATIGTSIGMVMSPGVARAGLGSVQRLVRQVDAAMYAAKDAGRNRYMWYSPEMLEKPQERPNFMQALSRRLLNR